MIHGDDLNAKLQYGLAETMGGDLRRLARWRSKVYLVW